MKNNTSKHHIDVINRYFYPVTAGIETNLGEICTYLAKLGWDVVVHTSKNTLTKKNVLSRGGQINGISIIRYDWHRYGLLPKLNWNNSDVISLHNFDVFPHFFILLFVLLLKILGRKRFVLIIMPHSGFNPDWSSLPKYTGFAKKIYHYSVGTFLINSTADGVRAISQWEKREMIDKGIRPELIKLIKNGTQDEALKDVDKLASKYIKKYVQSLGSYIIQIGRIHPIKNYETAIAAMRGVPQNLKFIIVGPDQDLAYKQRLIDLIDRLGLKDRVLFSGVVTDVDKYYLLKHAKLMVHMAFHEGYCNAVHEGLSQGLVCIVSDRTALPYLVKHGINGYCLDAYDSNGLAKKINYVLRNKESKRVREMQERNKNFASKYSWRNVAQDINAFYSQLIKRKDN